MPSTSEKQRRIMAIALKLKQGQIEPATVGAPAKKLAETMSTTQLRDFAKGPVKEAEEGSMRGSPEYPAMKAIPGLLRGGLFMRRQPTELDQALIERGKGQLFPQMMKNPGDPIPADMSSPTKGAGLYGSLAGAAGGAGGYGVGSLLGKPQTDKQKIALYSATISAVLAAMAAYVYRKERNDDLEDITLRLPEGATRRDMELNPVLGVEEGDMQNAQRAALVNAALRGRMRT